MTDVKIEISEIRQLSEGIYVATMEIGDKRSTAELELQALGGDVAGFNFRSDTLFTVVLYCCGFDKRFNDDFGRFLDGDRDLPWGYGMVEQVKIAQAVEKLKARTAREDGNSERRKLP